MRKQKLQYFIKRTFMQKQVNSLFSILESVQYWFIWKFISDEVIEEYARDTPVILDSMEEYFKDSGHDY